MKQKNQQIRRMNTLSRKRGSRAAKITEGQLSYLQVSVHHLPLHRQKTNANTGLLLEAQATNFTLLVICVSTPTKLALEYVQISIPRTNVFICLSKSASS